jgi:uncharacterized protein YndB with AHSA1/START domain
MARSRRLFETTREIAASPQTVWSVIVDVEKWPEWTPSMREVKRIDAGPLSIGSRARIKQPRLMPFTWTVTHLERGKGFTWTMRSPGVSVTARHYVDPTPGGSRATLSVQYGGLLAGLVARLTAPVNDRYLQLEADGLKARSESLRS